MRSFNPLDLPVGERHAMLLSAISPRPIAFASTVDEDGRPNLAPFSFFNVFSSNPPTMIFSPARGGRDGKLKHTLLNAQATKEVVINVVSYEIVQQMSLASTAYPEGVNEFEKSGLTMLASEMVKPFRVAESPAQFECEVKDIIELGQQGGAGNLVICEVKRMHFAEHIFNDENKIDPHKIRLVSRMGYNYYGEAFGDSVFEVEKPIARTGIGVDALPKAIRLSKVLTGNHLGMLGNIEALPTAEEASSVADHPAVLAANDETSIHKLAAAELDKGNVWFAWKILMV
ncbi:MAG: flavin reductase (DIM6/NTAB) family NADH-FMN oxidoreductase RutF [Limisphaerales bacterium]|jgi:flavin reductase (DIM6/NTAB) family NADH-FMN oxidoreductase RutF